MSHRGDFVFRRCVLHDQPDNYQRIFKLLRMIFEEKEEEEGKTPRYFRQSRNRQIILVILILIGNERKLFSDLH